MFHSKVSVHFVLSVLLFFHSHWPVTPLEHTPFLLRHFDKKGFSQVVLNLLSLETHVPKVKVYQIQIKVSVEDHVGHWVRQDFTVYISQTSIGCSSWHLGTVVRKGLFMDSHRYRLLSRLIDFLLWRSRLPDGQW